MEINEKTKLYRPNFCLVPLEARKDKTLQPAAKIYLGELNILCSAYGCCRATDGQLAEMQEVSEDTIKNWHKALEDGGYIKRQTWKEHVVNKKTGKLEVKTKRKIFMTEKSLNNVSEGEKNTPRSEGEKNTPRSEGEKNTLLTKEPLKKKENNNRDTVDTAQARVVVPSSPIDNLPIPDTLKTKLKREYSSEALQRAYDACNWETANNPAALLQSALKEEYKPKDTKQDITERNREEARRMLEPYKNQKTGYYKMGPYQITLGLYDLTFSAGSAAKVLELAAIGFISELKNMFNKLQQVLT